MRSLGTPGASGARALRPGTPIADPDRACRAPPAHRRATAQGRSSAAARFRRTNRSGAAPSAAGSRLAAKAFCLGRSRCAQRRSPHTPPSIRPVRTIRRARAHRLRPPRWRARPLHPQWCKRDRERPALRACARARTSMAWLTTRHSAAVAHESLLPMRLRGLALQWLWCRKSRERR